MSVGQCMFLMKKSISVGVYFDEINVFEIGRVQKSKLAKFLYFGFRREGSYRNNKIAKFL